MKKIFAVIITLIIVTFAGCDAKTLPDGFDETTVKQQAEKVITVLNSGDYEAFSNDLVSETLKSSLSAEVLENAVAQVMPEAGEFEKFSSEAVSSQKDKNGDEYVTAVVVAKYASQKVTYTISFDKDLKLIGFYLK